MGYAILDGKDFLQEHRISDVDGIPENASQYPHIAKQGKEKERSRIFIGSPQRCYDMYFSEYFSPPTSLSDPQPTPSPSTRGTLRSSSSGRASRKNAIPKLYQSQQVLRPLRSLRRHLRCISFPTALLRRLRRGRQESRSGVFTSYRAIIRRQCLGISG